MYNSNINFNLYKTFYEVAMYGSLSETAKKTYTSQPAISKAIKKLEEELDVQLFYRTLSGVELTREGEELFHYVEEAYHNFIMGERLMIESKNLENGKVSIGMPSNIGTFFLFDKFVEFHNTYPNIEITIITGSTTRLLNLLELHQVDFVIDTSPVEVTNPDHVVQKLQTVSYCFVVNKNFSYPTKIKSIEDLRETPLILPIVGTANRNDLDQLFEKHQVIPSNVLNIHTTEMIISAVKRNLGIGYVVYDMVEKDVQNGEFRLLEVKEKLPTVDINLIYNPKFLPITPKYFIEHYIMTSSNFKL